MYSSYIFRSDEYLSTSTPDAPSNWTELIGSEVGDEDQTSSSSNHAFFLVFVVFQLIGLAGSILMLLTVCISKTVKRRWSWINFVFTWIVSCTSYSLLVRGPMNWQPDYPLCLTQAALVYTVPTLTASASLALVIQVLISVRAFAAPNPTGEAATNDRRNALLHRLYTLLMVSLPYIAGTGMFAVSLVIGLKDRETVIREPGGFYCNMLNPIPGKLSAVIVAVIMLICLCLSITISIILGRNWRAFSSDAHAPLATVLRVLCFSAFSVVAVVLGLLFFFTPRGKHGPGLQITLAIIPVAAVLVFGSQTDLVRSWKAGVQSCFHFVQESFEMLFHLTALSDREQGRIVVEVEHRESRLGGRRMRGRRFRSMISLDTALA
ncbi:hypothetical protein DFH05DRAFT_938939 [Lentinula detonsa]|uniref:Uncharacterized protein n=1 Tax=Lentinula detonsa TaxID=2804962 RepID=A0A9W8TZJ2_9AGAR|nr:hypothetical protein DFH05DRAFT_938939 [Lentinula detonsa]